MSIYNRRVMRIAKHTYSSLALVLSLGLMYSQVCNVICAFSDCSAPAPVREAATVEHGGHCHQKPQSSQKDQPPDRQHRCPAHDSAASILPSGRRSRASFHITPGRLRPSLFLRLTIRSISLETWLIAAGISDRRRDDRCSRSSAFNPRFNSRLQGWDGL